MIADQKDYDPFKLNQRDACDLKVSPEDIKEMDDFITMLFIDRIAQFQQGDE